MTIQEKRPIVSMFSNLLIFSVYFAIVFNIYPRDVVSLTEELRFWGSAVVILVPVLIVAKILLYIMFSIVHSIYTNKREESFQSDEFGQLIKTRASKNFYHVFTAGFLMSMASLAVGLSVVVMFSIILFSLLAAALTQDVSEFYYTRRGL